MSILPHVFRFTTYMFFSVWNPVLCCATACMSWKRCSHNDSRDRRFLVICKKPAAKNSGNTQGHQTGCTATTLGHVFYVNVDQAWCNWPSKLNSAFLLSPARPGETQLSLKRDRKWSWWVWGATAAWMEKWTGPWGPGSGKNFSRTSSWPLGTSKSIKLLR